ncbi:hypothetical protein JCM12298_06970 [Desulfothermus naphthae]
MAKKRPIEPVKPEGMEIMLYYICPFCFRKVPVIAPLEPTVVRCDSCNKQFPVVPADDKTVKFLKAILNNGRAAIAPDFL